MGTPYHHGDVVCSFDEDILVFTLIKSFLITPSECLFVTELLQTDRFNRHFNSWEGSNTSNCCITKQVDLVDYHPIPLVRKRYVCMKHHVFYV